MKLNEKLSYLNLLACQFGRYRYECLPFGAAPADDMFQRKIDEIFIDMPNVFGITDDILVAGYGADDRDHDETVQRILQRCRQVNLKLNKDKMSFQVHMSPILWGGHIKKWSTTRPTENQSPGGHATPQQ